MQYVPCLIGLILGYLVGSIPFGYIIAASRGVDIRKAGSGNIGATNVYRTRGKGPGIMTFALDYAKGLLSVCVLPAAVATLMTLAGAAAQPAGPHPLALPLACAIGTMLGHSFPLYLGFKGGKGVATGVGIVSGLAPHSALLAVGVWIAVFVLGRYVSLASIFAAAAAAVSAWAWHRAEGVFVPAVVTALALLVIVRHRSNIRRLLNGTENRFKSLSPFGKSDRPDSRNPS